MEKLCDALSIAQKTEYLQVSSVWSAKNPHAFVQAASLGNKKRELLKMSSSLLLAADRLLHLTVQRERRFFDELSQLTKRLS